MGSNTKLLPEVVQLRRLEKTPGLGFSLLSSNESTLLVLGQGQGSRNGRVP